MLTVEEINQIPGDLVLIDWSDKELKYNSTEAGRAYLAKNSDKLWVVRRGANENLLVAGIYRPALIGYTPELYMLVCEAFRTNIRRNLLETKELVKDLLALFPHVIVQIDADYLVGQKFAEFMGFRNQQRREVHRGREYIVFEVTN